MVLWYQLKTYCINSSKVYCKLKITQLQGAARLVLIVAKCIVNCPIITHIFFLLKVLIVAKCIVNSRKNGKMT